MKITLSQFAGFCDGVKRAYETVVGLDISKLKKPVFVLGSLVHNAEVVKKIEEKGIGKIGREEFFAAAPGEIGTVIITAHGDGPEVLAAAKENGIDIIDTTCPKVAKVQRLAKVYAGRGHKIILVGDRDHKEVKGIDEWGNGKSFIVSEEEDLEDIRLEKEDKIAVLCQTTQSKKFFSEVVGKIEKKFPKNETIICDTVCRATGERQAEVEKMAKENDVVLVIGSKESANSKRLFEISASLNKNSYFVEKASDIEEKWLLGAESVAVTAGASTPPWIIEEVLEWLSKRN